MHLVSRHDVVRRVPRCAASAVLLLVAVTLPGCKSMQSMLGSMNKPSVKVAGVHMANFSLDKLDLVFDLDVTNPYSVPLPLTNLGYSLASGSTPFLTGQADVAGSIPAGQTKRLSVPATIGFSQLMTALKGVKPGSVVPYQANMNLSVDAPVVGKMTLPIQHSGEVPVPTVPKVQVAGVQWKNLSYNDASAVLQLDIENTNDFSVDLSKMAYKLSLGGEAIADSSVQQATQLPKGQTSRIEIPMSFSPSKLGLAAFNVLRGKGASYSIDGSMSLNTPFGPIDMPYQQTGKTVFK